MRRLRIVSPCPERWDDMQGNEDVRFCERCKKNVTTVRTAADLVPGMCVRILAATLIATGCSSANLEPTPARTVVTPPPEAGVSTHPIADYVGFLEQDDVEKR
jgi:hypothetical protein